MAGWTKTSAAAMLVLLASASTAQPGGYRPPVHGEPTPSFANLAPEQSVRFADGGTEIEQSRSPAGELAEHRLMTRALAALQPQRKGVVDAYVVAIALDSDPVFGREAREAGRVLASRYDAVGRTIVLAGADGSAPSDLPRGSPGNLGLALARVAELIDPAEDALILYTTSHGAPIGIVYNDGTEGFGIISANRLAGMLDGLGIRRRLVMVSACFSGTFVPALASDDSAVLTASVADRTSFGCQADSDWTFFGDALINHALRKPQPLAAAASEAGRLVAAWETRGKLTPSLPQVAIGSGANAWLSLLDRRTPRQASAPVGRPAVSLLDQP
ncbi:MAG: peptidase C13 [Sphingomonas sp. 28-66-16]|nr:MAG: peptidase C13 [Sphingomonas sp. 28-66-16]